VFPNYCSQSYCDSFSCYPCVCVCVCTHAHLHVCSFMGVCTHTSLLIPCIYLMVLRLFVFLSFVIRICVLQNSSNQFPSSLGVFANQYQTQPGIQSHSVTTNPALAWVSKTSVNLYLLVIGTNQVLKIALIIKDTDHRFFVLPAGVGI